MRASLLVAVTILLSQPGLAANIEGRILPLGAAARSDFVISVEDVPGFFPPPKEVAVMDQRELHFVPHVLVIQAGATVEFPNSDPVSHNVFSISPAKRFNLGLYVRGVKRHITFDQPGVVELLCHVHLEMSGYILVLKNPYYSRAGSDGTYRINGVPAGVYRVRCWSERFAAQERSVHVPAAGSVIVDFSVAERTR